MAELASLMRSNLRERIDSMVVDAPPPRSFANVACDGAPHKGSFVTQCGINVRTV